MGRRWRGMWWAARTEPAVHRRRPSAYPVSFELVALATRATDEPTQRQPVVRPVMTLGARWRTTGTLW